MAMKGYEKHYRTFNNRRYQLIAHRLTKSQAESMKYRWQLRGTSVRTVKVKGGYEVYILA